MGSILFGLLCLVYAIVVADLLTIAQPRSPVEARRKK